MLLTTTDIVDGYTVIEYDGRVSATLFFGYDFEVENQEREALEEIKSTAEYLGANAVIGIKSSISSGNSVEGGFRWCLHVSGTAVTLGKDKEQ